MLATNAVQPYLREYIILPTRFAVDMLVLELASMSVADYDLVSLLTDAVTALSNIHEAQARISQHAAIYQRWDFGRPYPVATAQQQLAQTKVRLDGDIISQAWSRFVAQLFQTYKHLGLWGSNGMCSYAFYDLQGRDIILKLLTP